MEDVLDIYHRKYDARLPVITFDESPYQLLEDVRPPLPLIPGCPMRVDSQYKRKGMVNIFLAYEPLTGRYDVAVTEHRKKVDWARYMEHIVNDFCPGADKLVLVQDNLNTHKPSSFYSTFVAEKARYLASKFDFHYTPKHGSWLNMAEIGFHILKKECLNRRISDIDTLRREISAWVKRRNKLCKVINWQYTTKKARIDLRRIYPIIEIRT